MGKKKEDKEEEFIDEEEFDYESDSGTPDFEDEPTSSLGLAHQISKESETIKYFKELPREVKYSFLDNEEKQEVKHFARTYRSHQYIEKIIDLRVKEDERLSLVKQNINTIKTKEDILEYFKNNNRDYLIPDILDLSDEEVKKIIKHVNTLKKNYMLDTIESNKKNIKILYEEYKEESGTPNYIDDMGNVGKVVDTSLASMGYKGNAANASVMTIQAIKNEDVQKVTAEKRQFGFMDAIRKKFG